MTGSASEKVDPSPGEILQKSSTYKDDTSDTVPRKQRASDLSIIKNTAGINRGMNRSEGVDQAVATDKTSAPEASGRAFYRIDRPVQAVVSAGSGLFPGVASSTEDRADGMRVLAGYLAEKGTIEVVIEGDKRVRHTVRGQDSAIAANGKSVQFADVKSMNTVHVLERRAAGHTYHQSGGWFGCGRH